VGFRAEEMEGHVRLIAEDPAVMPRRDGKDIAGSQLVDRPVFHLDGCPPRHHHADMRDLAGGGAGRRADMRRPFPPRLVGGSPNGHAAKLEQLKGAIFERTQLVGGVKSLRDNWVHGLPPTGKMRRWPGLLSSSICAPWPEGRGEFRSKHAVERSTALSRL